MSGTAADGTSFAHIIETLRIKQEWDVSNFRPRLPCTSFWWHLFHFSARRPSAYSMSQTDGFASLKSFLKLNQDIYSKIFFILLSFHFRLNHILKISHTPLKRFITLTTEEKIRGKIPRTALKKLIFMLTQPNQCFFDNFPFTQKIITEWRMRSWIVISDEYVLYDSLRFMNWFCQYEELTKTLPWATKFSLSDLSPKWVKKKKHQTSQEIKNLVQDFLFLLVPRRKFFPMWSDLMRVLKEMKILRKNLENFFQFIRSQSLSGNPVWNDRMKWTKHF